MHADPDHMLHSVASTVITWHLIRVYTVCHTYINISDTSRGSRMDYFKIWDKYGK